MFSVHSSQVVVAATEKDAHGLAWGHVLVGVEQTYRPRNPEENPLYGVVASHLETFLTRQRERDRNVPEFVERVSLRSPLPSCIRCGLVTEILEIFTKTVFTSLMRRAREFGAVRNAHCGAVSFILHVFIRFIALFGSFLLFGLRFVPA